MGFRQRWSGVPGFALFLVFILTAGDGIAVESWTATRAEGQTKESISGSVALPTSGAKGLPGSIFAVRFNRVAQASAAAVAKSAVDTGTPPKRGGKTPTSDAEKSTPERTTPFLGASTTSNNAPDLNGYLIGEQDVLTVTVWKEREISSTVVVRPDGIITVPLVGDLKVTGMTTQRVQALLIEKLKPFITVPQVTVAVNQINSRKVYLIGQVVREGTFPLNSSTTILQIIAEAGGLRDFAKRKSIYVLRQKNGEQVRLPFNYDAVIRGKKEEENVQLQPGDTIVVP
jgi:polysaccharide biosynthesis/export protein